MSRQRRWNCDVDDFVDEIADEDMNERMKFGEDSRAEWKDNRYPAVAFSQVAMVEICVL